MIGRIACCDRGTVPYAAKADVGSTHEPSPQSQGREPSMPLAMTEQGSLL